MSFFHNPTFPLLSHSPLNLSSQCPRMSGGLMTPWWLSPCCVDLNCSSSPFLLSLSVPPFFLTFPPIFFHPSWCPFSSVHLLPLHCLFLTLSFCSLFSSPEEEVENFDVSSLQEEALRNIEADSYWCMSKLLDGIQVSMSERGCSLCQNKLIKIPTNTYIEYMLSLPL